MYTVLSIWLRTVASNIRPDVNDRKSISYRLWQILLCLAATIDDGARFVLRQRAKCLWRCDQIRSRLTRNEFDRSLDMNLEVLLYLDKKSCERYRTDLIRRRRIAHERDFA